MDFSNQQNQAAYQQVQVPSHDSCNHNKELPGYRFSPTEEELIVYYLRRRFLKKEPLPGTSRFIHQVDIYKYHPEDLAALYPPVEDETCKENWYFFTRRQRKYLNGLRPARDAGNGYWKATGKDKSIIDDEQKIIGYKRSLVFHIGTKSPDGTKTDWHQKEYRITQKPIQPKRDFEGDMKLDDCVLCHIYFNQKRTKKSNGDQRKKAKMDDSVNNSQQHDNDLYEEEQNIDWDGILDCELDDSLDLDDLLTGQNPIDVDPFYNTGLIPHGNWVNSMLEPLPNDFPEYNNIQQPQTMNEFPVHNNIQHPQTMNDFPIHNNVQHPQRMNKFQVQSNNIQGPQRMNYFPVHSNNIQDPQRTNEFPLVHNNNIQCPQRTNGFPVQNNNIQDPSSSRQHYMSNVPPYRRDLLAPPHFSRQKHMSGSASHQH